MEFGKLESIKNVDWSIPADNQTSLSFLSLLPKVKQPQVYFGAPAWAHKEWVGKIYPEKTKATEYLYHYSRSYSCIELNTTHYRIPDQMQVEKWVSQVPLNFMFCPKLYQSISHSTHGLNDAGLIREWLLFLENLKNNCGPSFIQLPPHFDYSYKTYLYNFLQTWPQEFQLSIEFRHPSWFKDGEVLPALTEYLQSKNFGLVITDVAGRRDVVHTSISADYIMLRFIGNELHESDFTRAKTWIQKFKNWTDLGLPKIFLFIHEPADINVPEMTKFFIHELNDTLGTDLSFKLIETVDPQTSLL